MVRRSLEPLNNQEVYNFLFSLKVMEGGAVIDGGQQVRVTSLNEHVTCTLCRGYLIDATTVTECLHSCKWAIFYVL